MLQPMPLYKIHNYNTNNYHNMAPFQFNNNSLIVQPSFYNKLKGTWLEGDLLKHFDNITTQEGILYGSIPETDNMSEEEYNKYFKVYKSHLRWYDADKWYHILKRPSIIISYNELERQVLHDISNRIICGGSININEIERNDLKDLIYKLDDAIKKCNIGEGCFVKLSGCSVKHDFSIAPIYSGIGCLEHLLPSKRIFRNLDSYNILVQPWNDKIKIHSEFRVFIENNKVIGITQQSIYDVYQECISVYRLMYKEIIKMAQELWDSIKDQLEYTEATLDVWIDNNNENQMELIEINTYGIWTGAGSGWFDWESDFPVSENIKTLDDVPFRLTYPNSYFGIPDSM